MCATNCWNCNIIVFGDTFLSRFLHNNQYYIKEPAYSDVVIHLVKSLTEIVVFAMT